MWPRHVEVMLAFWLALSVFVFEVPERETMVWAVDLGAALIVIVSSLACYWRRTPRAHLVTLAVALALAAYGLAQPRPVPSWHQNHILVGLLLAMFAVLPSQAATPPRAWRT
jgi:hypothetical protein